MPALPTTGSITVEALWIGAGMPLAVFLALRLARREGAARRAAACALALLAGLGWAGWRAQLRLADELPAASEGRDVMVTGVVAELPQPLGRGVRFVLEVEEAEVPLPHRLLVSWYAARKGGGPAPEVHAGERWRLSVRLKRPHGFSNPGGFDYEAWLLERNLRATGYVRDAAVNGRLSAFVWRPMLIVHRLREGVRDRFAASLGEAPYAGILVALAIGEQDAIAKTEWEIFRRTGVAHLVAISGLHISLVAVLAGGLAAAVWRRFPALVLRCPVRRAAALAGLAAASGYALLAGLGIPTQRAIVMLAVGALALLAGRDTAPSRVLALALLAVLAADPWAVLAAGFWLSFGAVGAILFVLGGRVGGAPVGWRGAVRSQLAVSLATLPALLVLFQAFSLISPVANAFAIPLVSFLIVPLTLLAVVVPAAPLLAAAHWLAGLMVAALGWLAALPVAYWQQAAPPPWLAVAAMAAVAWLLLPRGTPARLAALAALPPLLAWSPPRPPAGGFVLTVLDVGHGLAVHVQTSGHDLLYDAGPRYGPESDAGERVLVPYLAALGVADLDRLVLSHDDIDHTGGALSVLDRLRTRSVLGVLPAAHPIQMAAGPRWTDCRAGARWQWDGVVFEVLHPRAASAHRRDNDRSCVLRVAGAGGSVLLAGDIEAAAEAELLHHYGSQLASTAVVVAHHGSRSSSTAAWVEAVAATEAVFPIGYRNPFRHPHPSIWARWRSAGTRNWRTDGQGAIRLEVDAGGVAVSAQREREPRYWHGR